MFVDAATPLAKIATDSPSATRVLLRHGLDFCCGGAVSLSAACQRAGLDLQRVRSEIEALTVSVSETRWDEAPLPLLIQHILDTYHAPLAEELNQLEQMASKVLRVHGPKDPVRLEEILLTVRALADELLPHARKEEIVLFPWIREQKWPRPAAPISVMRHDHEIAGELLDRAKELTNQFTPPPEACNTWRNLYARLGAFDAETREHIHLENNILFPRALAQ